MDFEAKSEVGDNSQVMWQEVEIKWIKESFICRVL